MGLIATHMHLVKTMERTEVLAGEPLILPTNVEPCHGCGGEGRREQTYTVGCGGGYYRSKGRCDYCDGWRYVYKDTGKHVSESVLSQISSMNKLTEELRWVMY